VGNVIRCRLAEEIAGYGHSDNASKLKLGYAGSVGEFVVGNGATERDAGVNFKVANPTEA